MKKIISIALLIAVVATMAIAASAGSLGQKYPKGDVALVDAGSITIDGLKDAAYANGAIVVADTYRSGYESENGTMNTNYIVWDGTYLYIFTEAKDNSPYEPALVKLLTESHNTDCIEYFIVWDNSDCPDVETYESASSMDLYQYRASYEPNNGGWFVAKPLSDVENEGFANGAEDTVAFGNQPGAITAGKVVPVATGYCVELQILMPQSNRAGIGSYNYGEGWKIAFITQQFDADMSSGWPISLTIPEVGTPSGEVMINKSTAWDCPYYDYIELKGNAAAADTTEAPADTTKAPETTEAPADTQTQAPDTTKAPAQNNPQTSDMAVAGVAILATLALAGVVVAKKVR